MIGLHPYFTYTDERGRLVPVYVEHDLTEYVRFIRRTHGRPEENPLDAAALQVANRRIMPRKSRIPAKFPSIPHAAYKPYNDEARWANL
jgi:hypothetical protein